MKPRSIIYTLGAFVFMLGLTMLAPLACSFYYGEGDSSSLILSMSITCVTGLILFLAGKPRGEKVQLSHKEGFLIVSLGWIIAALFGSLPYLIHGVLPSPTDAYFEAMSGFTTTGATVINRIDDLPHGILLWRSQTQWLGGMGIIILSIAILPFLGVGGRQLFKAEVPGPVKDKLLPRITETARSLWIVYFIITMVGFIFLMLGGMSIFDAINHIFCCMATGGFSTKSMSIAWYDSAYIDGVLVVFMLIAGINFTIHYQLLTGRIRGVFKDIELQFFLGTVLIAALLITLDLRMHIFQEIGSAFRYAIFQVSAIITTTGFVTDNFALWPTFSQVILVILMFIGGSSGSTGGGIKCIRIILLIKYVYLELHRKIHPHAITQVKIANKTVNHEVMKSVLGFFILYLFLAFFTMLVLSALGLDMITSFGAVVTTLSNVGPGLGLFHPESTYSEAPLMAKWLLSFCMMVGRLELYTVMVLLVPEFWKK